MSKIHLPLRILLVSLALLARAGNTSAAPAASEAAGAIVWKLPAASTSIELGSSLTVSPVFRGMVESVEASSLHVEGTLFGGGLALPATPHSARITSGKQKGRLLRILQNTPNSLVLETLGLPLNGNRAVESGDRFEILPIATLGTLLGRTAGSVRLQSGGTESTADIVQIWNGADWDGFFFSTAVTPARWVPSSNPTADANDFPLPPDTAFRILRRGAAKQLVMNGRVPPVRLFFRALEGTDNSQGAPFPVALPVAELSLGEPAAWGRSGSPTSADKIRFQNGGGLLTLFQDNSGTWRNTAAPAANLGNLALQPAGVLWVNNIGGPDAIPWFTLNTPYPEQLGPTEPPFVAPPPRPPTPVAPSLQVTTGTNVKVKAGSRSVRGVASSSQARISRVEYRVYPSRSYRPASGGSAWSFKAKLKPGKNVFYVRAIDSRGMASPEVKVTIKRK